MLPVQTVPLLIQVPINKPGKAEETSQGVWAPVTPVEDPDAVPGSCLLKYRPLTLYGE